MSRNLKNKAYSIIKDKILTGVFKPNEYLDEQSLCKITNTSRTPVREALNKLELEGWLNIIPRKGAQVPDITLKQVNDLFQARESIEPILLKISFANIDKQKLFNLKNEMGKCQYTEGNNQELEELDKEFHNHLLNSTNNSFIIKMMSNVLDHIEQIRRLAPYCMIRGEEARKEHIEIIESILNDNIEEAEALMLKHVQNTHLEFLKKIGNLNYQCAWFNYLCHAYLVKQ